MTAILLSMLRDVILGVAGLAIPLIVAKIGSDVKQKDRRQMIINATKAAYIVVAAAAKFAPLDWQAVIKEVLDMVVQEVGKLSTADEVLVQNVLESMQLNKHFDTIQGINPAATPHVRHILEHAGNKISTSGSVLKAPR